MRKTLFLVSFAALAGAIGLASAQVGGPAGERGGRLFQADANQDGAVTRAEFDNARAARFAQLDANNDGQLTREERRANRREHMRRGGRHHGRHMQMADANQDGVISREEFLARPSAMFDRIDANSDGAISEAERTAMREHARERFQQRRGERRGIDANGDQQISRAEFAALGATMFERLDANNDGRITREEAQAAHRHRGGGQ